MPVERRTVMGPPRPRSLAACDSCRVRKLKCNAKDLSVGSKCSHCLNYGSKCTFEHRNEPQLIIRARQNALATSIQQQQQQQRRDIDSLPLASQPPAFRPLQSVQQDSSPSDGAQQQSIQIVSQTQGKTRPAWDLWNMPTVIADAKSGRLRSMETTQVVELLLDRFYSESSYNSIIVPYHALSMCRIRYAKPTPIPSYLLHTMVACAATSHLTSEAEIQLWRSQAWHGATEAVHNRLTRSGPPELELIQSLLLLACNWSGPLLRVERINTFDTAISLATSIQLHSGLHLDMAPGPKSSRVILFWFLFCADKIVAVLLKRSPSIPTEAHSIPLPELQDVEDVCDLPKRTATGAWLQRLVHAMIQLSQITEMIQRDLILPVNSRQIKSLDIVFGRIKIMEKLLEKFCREQRWLLGTVPDMSSLCRSLSEAIITHLYFTQLNLYLPALQFEVNSRSANVNKIPFHFSEKSTKCLAATIESAWHLVRQPLDIIFHSQLSIPQIISMLSKNDSFEGASSTHMTFSHATFLVGVKFFKFLSINWSEWDSGNGCTRYSTIKMHIARLPPIQRSSPESHINSETSETTPKEVDLFNVKEDEVIDTSVAFNEQESSSTRRKSFEVPVREKQLPKPLQVNRVVPSNVCKPKTSIDDDSAELEANAISRSSIGSFTPVRTMFEGLDKIKRDIAAKATAVQTESASKETITAPMPKDV